MLNIFFPSNIIHIKFKQKMKITSAEQIFNNCKWVDEHSLVFDLHSALFKRTFKVLLDFDPDKTQKTIRKETLLSISDFQSLKEDEISKIYDGMWEYVISLHKGQLKTNDKGKSWIPLTLEDHLKNLKLKDKEDPIEKCPITGVGFYNDDDMDHSYFMIWMSPEWDGEHGLTAFYYNGILDHVGID